MKTIDRSSSDRDEVAAEAELCISCLQPNPPGTNFCRHCGTPLTAYAATGPLEHVFAAGDFARKAASRGRWAGWVRAGVVVLIILTLLGVVTGMLFP